VAVQPAAAQVWPWALVALPFLPPGLVVPPFLPQGLVALLDELLQPAWSRERAPRERPVSLRAHSALEQPDAH